MSEGQELGIVIYGATGYTGKLVAEYMNRQYAGNSAVPWALAGRSLAKLESVRDELNLPAEIPLVSADAGEPASIQSMVERAGVVISTVGPYQLYGSELIAACAEAGTDYVDLCGEPAWMKEMIEKYSEAAQASGARIVFSCGFDSIPFDLGVFYLQESAQKAFGAAASRVRGRVRELKGTWSGGTLASFKTTMAAAAQNPELLASLANPFALTPGFVGAEQPNGMQPKFDKVLDSWVAPFIMATINTKNIHRSNLLLEHKYGEGFRYDEMLITGSGDQGEAIANAVAQDTSMADDPIQPGDGASREERESGCYDLLFVGQTDDGQSIRVGVTGDMDPGYGSTSKMIAESAMCLFENPGAKGGIFTAAAAMGSALIERLQQYAGLTFEVENPE